MCLNGNISTCSGRGWFVVKTNKWMRQPHPDDLIFCVWRFGMWATSETHHVFFSFSPSTSIHSLNDMLPSAENRYWHDGKDCWQFPLLPPVLRAVLTPKITCYRCHANCTVLPVATSAPQIGYWDELHSVFMEKIIGILIRAFSGHCRRYWITGWTLSSLNLIEFGEGDWGGRIITWISFSFYLCDVCVQQHLFLLCGATAVGAGVWSHKLLQMLSMFINALLAWGLAD